MIEKKLPEIIPAALLVIHPTSIQKDHCGKEKSNQIVYGVAVSGVSLLLARVARAASVVL